MSKYINPLYELCRGDGFINDSKVLRHAIGINETSLYAQLLASRSYFEDRDELTEDGYFFQTIEKIEYETALTEKQQRNAIKNLQKFGLIEVKLQGVPPKRYFRVIDDLDILETLAEAGRETRKKLHAKYLAQRQRYGVTKKMVKNGITGCH